MILIYIYIYVGVCSISRISPSWARAGCKKTLCLLHYPCKIKFIHSFILSLSLWRVCVCVSVRESVHTCAPVSLCVEAHTQAYISQLIFSINHQLFKLKVSN